MSSRAAGPFVAVNCAALPETLLESELFGHERGAFTGADRARQGLFETAHRGTLLLDEAGEMSPALQAKLLRVLTDGRVVRVGATTSRPVDVRILVATHRNLEQRVREGSFREDLYYRIAVVPLVIPPLRERLEDLPVLVDSLLAQLARDLNMSRRAIRPEALEKLKRYAFPGNVRELRNLLERAYILGGGETLGAEDFPFDPPALGAAAGPPQKSADAAARWLETVPERIELRATIDSIERSFLVRALRSAGGVHAEAARSLGISRSDMAYKVKKYGLVKES
jgi:transcriptional regulator with GAF, ATPase, and Fis domain